MEKRFKDKVSIVTGGAMGIGKGVALLLAREGSIVVVADINKENAEYTVKEIKKMGGEATGYVINLLNVKEIEPMIAGTVETYGRLDIMVNAAGVAQNKPFLDITEEDWDRIININQKSTTFCVRAAAEQMIKQIPAEVIESGRAERSYGKIVNFSSISGRSGRPLQVHYAAAKAAIISITQSAALAFARYNINVNAVSPSVVKTSMWEYALKEKSRVMKVDPVKEEKEFIGRIPLQRPGRVEDVAMTVAFLCSSDSDYITGQTINVDGGFEMN